MYGCVEKKMYGCRWMCVLSGENDDFKKNKNDIQPVPEKMRLEMLVETQIEIVDDQRSYLFSNEPFKKRPKRDLG